MYLSYQEEPHKSVVHKAMGADGLVKSRYGDAKVDFSYDSTLFGFRELVERHFRELGYLDPNSNLEALTDCNSIEDLTVDASGQSKVSSSLYEIDGKFYDRYVDFLRTVVRANLVDFNFYFQAQPTFRCSIPGSPGYNWRPNYHCDIAIGHPPDEINFWIPLTICYGNNSLVYADLEDSLSVWRSFDYNFEAFHRALDTDDDVFDRCRSITKSYDSANGRGLMFDSRIMHLHQKNDTPNSRVSFDFRIIPVESIESRTATFVGTGRRKASFLPGDYYSEKSIDHI